MNRRTKNLVYTALSFYDKQDSLAQYNSKNVCRILTTLYTKLQYMGINVHKVSYVLFSL